MSARYDVMIELYELLNGDDAPGGLRDPAGGLVDGVYDEPPQDAVPPYLQLGDATETPMHSFTSEGWDVVCSLRIWTEYAGFLPAAAALKRISELIERDADAKAALVAGLAERGWSVVRADYLQSDSLREPDNPQRSVPVRVRVWVERPR